jgi:hypothetical protein
VPFPVRITSELERPPNELVKFADVTSSSRIELMTLDLANLAQPNHDARVGERMVMILRSVRMRR